MNYENLQEFIPDKINKVLKNSLKIYVEMKILQPNLSKHDYHNSLETISRKSKNKAIAEDFGEHSVMILEIFFIFNTPKFLNNIRTYLLFEFYETELIPNRRAYFHFGLLEFRLLY